MAAYVKRKECPTICSKAKLISGNEVTQDEKLGSMWFGSITDWRKPQDEVSVSSCTSHDPTKSLHCNHKSKLKIKN